MLQLRRKVRSPERNVRSPGCKRDAQALKKPFHGADDISMQLIAIVLAFAHAGGVCKGAAASQDSPDDWYEPV